jgi:release factor glutamine methyltransferase
MNLGEALILAKEKFNSAGTPSSSLNAEVLLQRLLGVEKVFLVAHSERILTTDEEKSYFEWVARRARGEPAQYITGHQEFWGLDFEVSPAVLIPRPETEHVIETVLKLNQSVDPKIVDVGTGSGCIAVALAKEIPQARLFAVEQSKGALQVAARNAERLGVSSRIEFVWGDALAPFELERYHNAFDFIVSNPPYVAHSDRPSLQVEVRDHEPKAALHSADDNPIQVYRRLVDQSLPRLCKGGFLVVEIGAGQNEVVEALFSRNDWSDIHFVNDLQSIPRGVAASRL